MQRIDSENHLENSMQQKHLRFAVVLASLITPGMASSAEELRFPHTDGHRTRQDHINYCVETRWQCLNQIGPSTVHESLKAQCRITYDQCMRRAPQK